MLPPHTAFPGASPGWHRDHQQRPCLAPRSSVASRKLRGGLWRAAVGKTGRLTVEWGTTAEHTEWGACAEHARLQLNDNDD